MLVCDIVKVTLDKRVGNHKKSLVSDKALWLLIGGGTRWTDALYNREGNEA
jgi:hypothetical protein